MTLGRRVDAGPRAAGRLPRAASAAVVGLSLACAACNSALRPGGGEMLARITGSASNSAATTEKPSAAASGATRKPSADAARPLDARTRGSQVVAASYAQDLPAATSGGAVDLGAPETMTLDQVVQTTVRTHPLLRAREAEIAVAEAGIISASLWPNPQLVLDQETPTQEAGPTEITSRLMFTIPLGGRLAVGAMAADMAAQKARYTLSRETEVIIDQAVVAALEVLYWQELVVLQAELVEQSRAGAAEVERAVMAGTADDSAGALAQVRAEKDEFDRLDSDSKLRGARIRLSKAIGLSPPREIHIAGRLTAEAFPDVPLEAVLAAVRENRPELAEARSAIAQSRRELALAHAESIPDLEFGPRFRDRFREPTDTLGARVNFDLPLFDRKQGDIAEKEAEIRMNQANYQLAEMTTLNDVAEAYAELMRLRLKLEHTEQRVLPLIEQAAKSVQEAYGLGEVDAHRLTNELERLAEHRIDHLELRYRYTQLRAKIELYTGRSLSQMAAEAAVSPRPPARETLPPPARQQPLPNPPSGPALPPARTPELPMPSDMLLDTTAPDATPPETVPPDTAPPEGTPPGTTPGMPDAEPESQADFNPGTRTAGAPRIYGGVRPAGAAEPIARPIMPKLVPPLQADEKESPAPLKKIEGLDLIAPQSGK